MFDFTPQWQLYLSGDEHPPAICKTNYYKKGYAASSDATLFHLVKYLKLTHFPHLTRWKFQDHHHFKLEISKNYVQKQLFADILQNSYSYNPHKIHRQKPVLEYLFNLSSANPTKWPNTLKKFVAKLSTNCLSVFGHFAKLTLKGLSKAEACNYIKKEIPTHVFSW